MDTFLREKRRILINIRLFVATLAVLVITGVVFVYSSSCVYALERFGTSNYFLQRHLIGCLLGCGALMIGLFLPPSLLKRWSPYLFGMGIFATGLTLVPFLVKRINGSGRWLSCGSLVFQPSELLKVTFILYSAYFFEKKERRPNSFINCFLPMIVILCVCSILLLRQPDFGLAMTLCATAGVLLFIAQGNVQHLLITIIATVPLIVGLIAYKPYRLQRILIFLDPWSDPQGAGFQIVQSLIAIGSGGLWGVGIGNSRQKFFYLPMQYNDFILAIIAEETGFLGVLFLIGVYFVFMQSGLRLANWCRTSFGRYLVLGFVGMITLQTIINMSVVSGLLPTKGLGLPFVSYGNSNLIVNFFMVGVVIRCLHEEFDLIGR